MEEVVVFFLEILFVYPGAAIRWFLFYKNKKSIKEVAQDDWFKNSSIGVLAICLIIGLIYTIIK
jgi:hypothetical protein